MSAQSLWQKQKSRHLSKCRKMRLHELVQRFHATDNAGERIVIHQYVKENYELTLQIAALSHWSWKQ